MLDQHRRHWADVVKMLYKLFVLTGMLSTQDDGPMAVHCWPSVVGGGPAVNHHWVKILTVDCDHMFPPTIVEETYVALYSQNR